jgi:hypothetical protein
MVRTLSHVFFLDPSPVRRVPIQTGIQRKLNFVSVRTIKGSSSCIAVTAARASTGVYTSFKGMIPGVYYQWGFLASVCVQCQNSRIRGGGGDFLTEITNKLKNPVCWAGVVLTWFETCHGGPADPDWR